MSNEPPDDNGHVPPIAPIGNEANRRIVQILVDHALALQAQVQVLRQMVGTIWANPQPYDVDQLLELELWFRRRSSEDRKAAHAIHQVRRQIP